jgi:hypothetical protein
MLRSKALTGGAGTHQSIGGGTGFHMEMGALRPLVVTFVEGRVPVRGWSCLWAVPLLDILCRSAPPDHNGSKLGA